MAKTIKSRKADELRVIHRGTHTDVSDKENLKYYNWEFQMSQDQRSNKLVVQQFEIKDKERSDVGEPEVFSLHCPLTRYQCRLFVRNLKS